MKKTVGVLLIGLLIFSCQKNTNMPLSFDYGSVKDGVYDNAFFKFELPVNPEWYILNNDETDLLYEIGSDYAAGGSSSLKKDIDASQINVAKLITVFKAEPGTTVDFNPSIIINAENIKMFPDVDTADKYFVHAKKLLKQMAMDIEYGEEIDKIEIGSQDFAFMNLKNKINTLVINQDYYVVVKQGFAISFILSYTSNEDKKILYEMFDKLEI